MKSKPIILIAGEPYSIFYEIFFKALKNKNIKKIKSPILLVGSKKLLIDHMKALNYKFNINEVNKDFSNFIQKYHKIRSSYKELINLNYKKKI